MNPATATPSAVSKRDKTIATVRVYLEKMGMHPSAEPMLPNEQDPPGVAPRYVSLMFRHDLSNTVGSVRVYGPTFLTVVTRSKHSHMPKSLKMLFSSADQFIRWMGIVLGEADEVAGVGDPDEYAEG